MTVRGPAFQTSPTNPLVGEIQTHPARKKDMPYAPAIRIESPGDKDGERGEETGD